MKTSAIAGAENALATLRRLARGGSEVEQCEFCRVVLPLEHRHLFESATRKVICACDPCALRFDNVVGRWQLIPRDPRCLIDFQMADADWQALAIPIELAFLVKSTSAKRVVAMYPSPAGATESLLPLANWQNIVAANPVASDLKPDVEALLVNRLSSSPRYYIAPIDLCFELVGLIRLHWRGFSGGERIWKEIEAFFNRLELRASGLTTSATELAHA